MTSAAARLSDLGQSAWYDNLTREVATGGLDELIRVHGISGVTSNPTIFQKAIQGSSDYDGQFAAEIARGLSPVQAYWELVVSDIHGALDAFSDLHAESDGEDGYVSLEVAPRLAYDIEQTVAEAKRLFTLVGAPNVLIKVPSTPKTHPHAQHTDA